MGDYDFSLSPIGQRNAGYLIVAAVPTGTVINDQPEYVVIGLDSERNQSVTWMAAYQFTPGDWPCWRLNCWWGHYFRDYGDVGDEMNHQRRARYDMAQRLGIQGDILNRFRPEL